MKKIAIIPTKAKENATKVSSYLKDCGWEVCVIENAYSIFDAVESTLIQHKVMAKDLVLLCHDDIEIQVEKKYFNNLIEENITGNKTGFLGLAGAKKLLPSGVWWEGLGKWDNFSGYVLHNHEGEERPTIYGPHGNVQVLDGLFLVAKGGVWNSIQVRQPDSFTGNWDFYDIFYTFQAHLKGFQNKTIPIRVLHDSLGEIKGRKGWEENRVAFSEMFHGKFKFRS